MTQHKHSSSTPSKVSVITGGSTGIGLATAQRLAQSGHHVFLFARSEHDLAAARNHIDGEVTCVAGSVTSSADLTRLFESVKAANDHLDALLVNAGIAEFSPLAELDEAHFDRVFDVNVKGALFTLKHALPLLVSGSSVVFTTSVAGRIGAPNGSVYGASKAAMRSLVRSLAAELLPLGVRVNAVSPGPTETPILSKITMTDAQAQEMAPYVHQRMRLGRLGRPAEVAAAAAFLLSDEASFIVGQELAVDGGLSAL